MTTTTTAATAARPTAPAADVPDLTNYRGIHQALRAGAATLARGARALDGADARRRTAYARYWAGYRGEVLAHHSIEDDVFFPDLVARVPVAAALTDRTGADHLALDELLHAVDREAAALRAGQPAPRLVGLTAELSAHMDEHLDFEDREVLPLFERHYSAAEYAELDERALKSLGLGRQAAFTVPFVMASVPPEQAREALAGAPVPLKVLYRLTRRSHARLVRRAFGAPVGEVAR